MLGQLRAATLRRQTVPPYPIVAMKARVFIRAILATVVIHGPHDQLTLMDVPTISNTMNVSKKVGVVARTAMERARIAKARIGQQLPPVIRPKQQKHVIRQPVSVPAVCHTDVPPDITVRQLLLVAGRTP